MLARLPFRLKLLAASALALIVVTLALTAVHAAQIRQALHAQLVDSAIEQQPFIVAALAAPLLERDYATVQAIVAEAAREQGLAHLVVADARGTVIAERGWSAAMVDADGDTPIVGPDGKRRIAFRTEIRLADQHLGEARFGFRYEHVDAAVRAVVQRSALIALPCVALTILLVEVLQSRLTRPLLQLARASEQVRRGDYDIDLAPSAQRDIGALVDSFRMMTDEIRDRIRRLTESETAQRRLLETAHVREQALIAAKAALAVQTAKLEQSLAELQAQERVLAQALEKERIVTQQQRRFVSVAAHEFRTPLTIIDGAAQRLARYADRLSPAELRERAEKIRLGVARMGGLMDTLLDAARLEDGAIAAESAELDVAALVRQVCERAQPIAGAVSIDVTLPASPLRLRGDARLLDQVFTNLVTNAVKYSGDGRRVDVTVAGEAQAATIVVRDYGIGIPEDELPRLFDRYFRASTARGIPGTGLGLNLARALVELHGGTIALASKVAEGTTVTVRLPLDRALPAPASPQAA